MSSFDLAIPTVLKNEGGYSDDKDDSGGATNFGISQGFLDEIQYQIPASKITREIAISLYKEHFWIKGNYGEIAGQNVATKIFDLSVNIGVPQANKTIQRAIRATDGEIILDDGILGSISIDAINSCSPDILIVAIRSEAAGFYRLLKQPKFIKGWLNRAYS